MRDMKKKSFLRMYSGSTLLSVGMHLALLSLFVFGVRFATQPLYPVATDQVAIQATVVDESLIEREIARIEEQEQAELRAPCLVVVPTSLVSNWAREARLFAPELDVLILHGSGRHAHFDRIEIKNDAPANSGVFRPPVSMLSAVGNERRRNRNPALQSHNGFLIYAPTTASGPDAGGSYR